MSCLLLEKFDTMEIWGVLLTAKVRCCFCVAIATGLRQRFSVGEEAEERDSQHFIRKLQQFHVWLRVAVISHIVISHLLSPSLLISSTPGMKCQTLLLVFGRKTTTQSSGRCEARQSRVIVPQEGICLLLHHLIHYCLWPSSSDSLITPAQTLFSVVCPIPQRDGFFFLFK